MAVQKTNDGEMNWIIETKGRVWEDTKAKDHAISLWCKKVTEQTGKSWRYLRVNQTDFVSGDRSTLEELTAWVGAKRSTGFDTGQDT